MAPIVASVEVARPPGEVFAYVTDPQRLPEWQWGVAGASMASAGQPAAGSRFTTTTRFGGTEQVATLEITEFSPPAIWAARGVDGPVRVSVRVTVDPLDDGARSRVTLAVDFAGSGAGRMLIPVIVRPQAAREAPRTVERLRQRLEDR